MSHYPNTGEFYPPKRRLWLRRTLIGVNVFVAICVVIAGVSYGYISWRWGQIPRLNLGLGGSTNDEPMNVLLVGSDSRANLSAEKKKFGSKNKVTGQRSDTIMILHIEPKSEKAAILSIPRDLYLPIADSSESNRINTAYERGRKPLIDTIEQSLDIPINHYVEVDFTGFRDIVNDIGGVKVYFPSPARDSMSGLKIPKAGCIELDGEAALSYARARNYQTYESGRWRQDPTADLGRIQRQQDFIRRMIGKALSKAKNPKTLDNLVASGVKSVTIDDELSPGDVLRLTRRFKSLEPSSVEMLTIPTYATSVGEASVLKLKEPDAQAVIERFKGTPEPEADVPPPANSVRVRVLNGSGIGGQAKEVADDLAKQGFNVADTGDADAFKYSNTVIRYGKGQKDKAELLETVIEGKTVLQEDTKVKGVDVVLITGTAYDGIAEGTTPTSAKPAIPVTTTTLATESRGAGPNSQC